ncbi:MAG: hypothetical protein HFJ55_03935 [Clostridia bacterium]|jgi:hypothetical protein|nr:hypothetical protein [Clostridia bacterium]
MKIIINLIKFALITILTICMISVAIITTISSTVLNQNFVVEKLEESEFYTEMYELVKSNFENYIYQSGLDEVVLENICTKEKVKKDINTMLTNIYKGTNEKIDTTEIKTNLDSNIQELGVKNTKNEKAINEFIEHICNEYKDTIVHTEYEGKINNIYSKVVKIFGKVYNASLITIGVSIVLLIVINIKRASKNIQDIGIGLLATATFSLTAYNTIVSKINIEGIKIFNDTYSNIIVAIIQEIVGRIFSIGIGALVVSIVLILIYAVIVAVKNPNEETITEK